MSLIKFAATCITGIIAGTAGVLFLTVQFIEKPQCTYKWDSFNPTYSFYAGCQIEVNGIYIPAEAYGQRVIDN